jgi:hypothetical protein
VDAFARQVGQWCAENGLLFTGHVLAEEGLRSQTGVVGSAMRFYEFMQAPGIDVLREQTPATYEYSTAKQCASVLHQTGRRWLLSELYGCTGWDFPFEGHKAVGDWQAALGVNLRCQHLSWYTMAGEAKRDYPASIHFQSPWWRHYRKVEDYFARLGAVMSRGVPVRRLLVIHPVESVWARATIGWGEDESIGRLGEQFQQLLRWLLDGHVDFDYGDEEMIGRLASVEAGGEALFRLGAADYAVVLVPPADTLRATTVEVLEQFRRAGGAVIFCAEAPALVDCEPCERAAAVAAESVRVPFERGAVLAAVKPARVLSIADHEGNEKPGVLYLLHREGDELRLFICTADRRASTGPLSVCVRAEGQVQVWDAESGERYAVDATPEDGAVRFATELPPSGSRLFVITPEREELPSPERLHEVRAIELPAPQWRAELTEPNVLVLDMPECRIGDGHWRGPLEVLKVDTEIRKAAGLRPRGGAMVQPWARLSRPGPAVPFTLRYRFVMDECPPGPLHLAIEAPQRYQIRLNGSTVPPEAECGWWVDPAIRLLPLDEAALRRGENVLELSGAMEADCDLEICYLLGAFAVEVDGAHARIAGALTPVTFGDWTEQGLPFYAGSVVFRAAIGPDLGEGERLFVEVPGFAGACVRVLVDGNEVGIIGWPPHEVEITDAARGKERATLAVEVVGHRRNAFGPLHHVEARPPWVGPDQFVSSGERWQDAYNLLPLGCPAPPRLSVRQPHQGNSGA